MVWFSEEVVTLKMIMSNKLLELKTQTLGAVSAGVYNRWKHVRCRRCALYCPSSCFAAQVQVQYVETLERFFETNTRKTGPESNYVTKVRLSLSCSAPTAHGDAQVLAWVEKKSHVMEYDRLRLLSALFSLLHGGLIKIIEYNESHMDFPLNEKQVTWILSREPL